jgi:hypothetical protein
MHNDLGLLSFSVIGSVGRLDRDRGRVPRSLQERQRALAGAGKIRGSRGAEEFAKVVLELLVNISEVQVLHLDRMDRSVVSGRADWHDLYKHELCMRIGVGIGERIVIGAPTATRPKVPTPPFPIDIVGAGDRRRGLQGGEGIASGGVRRVVGGDDALADDVKVFSGGLVKKTMHHDTGFGGIRCLVSKKPVSSGTKVELAGGGKGDEGGDGKGGELHGGLKVG